MLDRVVVGQLPPGDLSLYVPADLQSALPKLDQKVIPGLARDQARMADVEAAAGSVPTRHELVLGDARDMASIPAESVHLVVTSPPYWTLKEYPAVDGQLGSVADYEEFLSQLDMVWEQVYRILVPGGRLVVVVGDVCLPRRRFGRHAVFPLHASIQEHCRRLGYDNVAPIIWYKIANAQYESGGNGGFLGKPYEPNAVVKNDIEYVLSQRKPGGYRQTSAAARILSTISQPLHQVWYRQVWTDIRGSSTRHHPAPYPLELAERLIRMFSFVGDVVLDPFMGTGTTNAAAQRWGRSSIGYEVVPAFFEMAAARVGGPRQSRLTLAGD